MRWAVIADDLTGAADTGVQFAKRGQPTLVLLDWRQVDLAEVRVVAADTESRHRPAAEAYARTRSAIEALSAAGVGLFYKKMDSALRGNLGAELDAALDASGRALAVVAPAFPANWRTTVDGHQLIEGVPLEQTAFAQDPRQPVSDSFIPHVLARQSRRRIGLLGLEAVRAGVRALVRALHDRQVDGYQIVVVDAAANRDLRTIAAAVSSPRLSCLGAGSAGLAEALAVRLPRGEQLSPAASVAAEARVLVVAGSAHPQTAEQVEALQASGALQIVDVPVDGDTRASSLPAVWRSDGVVLLRLAGQVQNPQPDTGQRLATRLATVAAEWLRLWQPVGLLLVGGDTAIAVLAALGASGLLIQREVQAGVPAGLLAGGKWHDLPVVTKAGAFGDRWALVAGVAALRSAGSDRRLLPGTTGNRRTSGEETR